MSIQRSILGPALTTVLTSPLVRDTRREILDLLRRARGQAHRVHYFHRADDPHAHLAVQVLGAFRDAYDVELIPRLVSPPSDAAAPERDKLMAWARRDAAAIAPFYGLVFDDPGRQPAPELVARAHATLAAVLDRPTEFTALAPRVGAALWKGDRDELEGFAREAPAVTPEAAERALAAGTRERESLGHYLGGTFHYGGEWFWGVDRLHYLERRLADLRLRRGGNGLPLARIRLRTAGAVRARGDRLRLEFFLSLRSPYSYIAMPRVFSLPGRHPVDVVPRPVLPMVMRGLPVPQAKRLYILFDTKREAERVGVPFGTVSDPVGRPIELGLSLFPWARERGRAAEFLHSFAKAAFADGIDTGSEAGLRRVVERAGLSWSEAQSHVGNESWRPEIEENRRAMFGMGLWGVPSFRLSGPEGEPDFSVWGQDRLWLVEEEVRRRLT